MPPGKFNLDFIKNIKELLSSKNSRLKAEQKKLIEDDPYLQEGRDSGNAEEMDEAILEDLAKSEIEVKKKNIGAMRGQVKKALDRLEKGEYGICENCGNPIDKARLKAYPEASLCLDCANRAANK